MLFTIAVTSRPVLSAANSQIIEPEKIIVPPDNKVLAADQNAALVLFGSVHADVLAKTDPSTWVVQVRQGV